MKILAVGTGVGLFALLLGVFSACSPGATSQPAGTEYADAHLETPSGDVGYRSNESATLDAFGLPDPSAGTRYAAWLATKADANSKPTKWIRLGVLAKHENEWTTTFNGSPGTNVMALGNTLEIIREDASAQPPRAPAPTDPVVLQGTYPADTYTHLQHLLVAWPDTPQNAGLLVAMRHQGYILQGEAQALKEAAYRGDAFAVSCHAQSVLDILEGKPGGDYAALDPKCVNTNVTDQIGDGYGFLGTSGQGNYGYEPYIQAVEFHMDKAVQALGGATNTLPELRDHAGHVHSAMENVRTLLSAAQQDALKLRQNPGMSTATDVAGDLAAKCDAALQWAQPQGAALDPAQFGVVDADTHTQFAATLHLTPPSTT